VSAALRIPGKTRPLMVRPLLAFSLPLMFSLLTGYLLFHIDVLMLGALASLREVGLYSVATRLALPLFLVLDSVARAFAPLAAHLYSHDQSRRLATVYAAATEWVLAINVPAGVLIAVNAEPILALFGQEFVAAAPALRVLSAGIVVATACGTAASMLTMTRWQRLEMFDNLLLLSLNVVLNLMLVPRFGALGAAAATASSAGAVYALKVVQARWLLGVQPFRWRQLATLVLAGACAALAWAATWPFALDSTTALAARVGVFAASYVVLWWRWGVSPSSREVLQAIVGRNRSA
jgi:O-antigen/teichoic acid export membrane protein